jgi:hypothetical protein
MAALSELAETVAAVEGIDPARVSLIARNIREGRLITTRGRGTSAAIMNVTDAANLLIGVNATINATEAARVVSTYREFVAYEIQISADPRPPRKYGTLGAAIEQLIQAAGSGELTERFLDNDVPYQLQESFPKGEVYISLGFQPSKPLAYLKIAAALFADVVAPDMAEELSALVPGPNISLWFYPPKSQRTQREKSGDRTEEIRIGYPTLRAVGQLIMART